MSFIGNETLQPSQKRVTLKNTSLKKEHGKESKAGTDGLNQQPGAQESIVSVPNADLDAHFITGSF